jgi:hypothetical protein
VQHQGHKRVDSAQTDAGGGGVLGRFGGTDLSHNTMAASIVRVGAASQPVINLIRDHLLDSPLVFGDETTVQVLKEPGRAAQSKSYMWVQMTEGSRPEGTGPPIRLFGYSPSRSTDAAVKMYAVLREGSPSYGFTRSTRARTTSMSRRPAVTIGVRSKQAVWRLMAMLKPPEAAPSL